MPAKQLFQLSYSRPWLTVTPPNKWSDEADVAILRLGEAESSGSCKIQDFPGRCHHHRQKTHGTDEIASTEVMQIK
jgi:hypothetical protein